MKISFKVLIISVFAAMGMVSMSSCSDGRSYAEMLSDENKIVNVFLADHRVITEVPADTVFETGPDAPYYQLDEDGNIYMQVITPGYGPKAVYDQEVYFRYTRYNMYYYQNPDDEIVGGEGNSQTIEAGNASFRYDSFQLPSSQRWGTGLQMPLKFLPLNCEVNLVIKSTLGITSEIGSVMPYLYNVRYYKRQS